MRAERILKQLDALSQCSDNTMWRVRSLGLKGQAAVLDELAKMMRTLGLEVYRDLVGNLRGRLTTYNSDAQYLLIGGYADTVKKAGKFDGVFNILMALEVLAKLLEENRSLPFHVEVVVLVDGARTYFDLPYLGCRYLVGQFDPSWLERKNKQGQVLRELIRSRHGEQPISQTRLPKNCLAYLQFTLADSNLLDQKMIAVGLSQGICGHVKFRVRFSKAGGYNAKLYGAAGANVVVYAFSNAVSQIEYYVRQRQALIQSSINNIEYEQAGREGVVAALGFEVTLFGLDDKILSIACQTLKNQMSKLTKNYAVTFEFEVLVNGKAVRTDSNLNRILGQSILQAGSEVEEVQSFEGQPLSFLASLIPSCMLVLRSEKGIYRHPDEYVRLEDIMVGLKVGEHFLRKLAEEVG